MSGAAAALEAAILAMVAANDGARGVLGDPVRVRGGEAERPAWPFLEIIRHEIVEAGAADGLASEHRVDIQIVFREGPRGSVLEALGAVWAAVEGEPPDMDGWRCVLLLPVFRDVMTAQFGGWRGLMRVKAVVGPA